MLIHLLPVVISIISLALPIRRSLTPELLRQASRQISATCEMPIVQATNKQIASSIASQIPVDVLYQNWKRQQLSDYQHTVIPQPPTTDDGDE